MLIFRNCYVYISGLMGESQSGPANRDLIGQMLYITLMQSKEVTDTNSGTEIAGLEIQDYLKLLSHQKKNLTSERWSQLSAFNQQHDFSEGQFKYSLLVCSQANYRCLNHPGYYKQIVTLIEGYPSRFLLPIEKDVPRTFPNGHLLQDSLRRVLCAYAIRNPSLLYCQGMNYIVAFVLINGLLEEEAFWFLVSLIEEILPESYFKNLNEIKITSQIFRDVLEVLKPEFAAGMQAIGMESSMFLVTWYICVFTKGFTNSVSRYLITLLILESRVYSLTFVILRISLGIICCMMDQQSSVVAEDFKSFKDNLQSQAYEIKVDDIKRNYCKLQLDYEIFTRIYDSYAAREVQRKTKSLQYELSKAKLSLPPCKSENPVCLHRVEISRKIGNIEEVFVTKSAVPIGKQTKEKYWQKPTKQNKLSPFYETTDECLITRHSHICSNRLNEYRLQLRKAESVEKEIDFERSDSMEVEFRSSSIIDKYAEYSQYFEVDAEMELSDEQCSQEEEENTKQSNSAMKIRRKGQQSKPKKIAVFLKQALNKVWGKQF